MKSSLRMLAWMGVSCLGAACVSAPKETVELSEIVDEQIARMQVSHEGFVRLYYASLREDVNTFMEERWIPTFLQEVLTPVEAGLRIDLSELEDPGGEAAEREEAAASPGLDLTGLGADDRPSDEERFRRDLDKAYRMSKVDWAQLVDASDLDDPELAEAVAGAVRHLVEEKHANLGAVMMNFSRATQRQINKRRASLLRSIDEQEAQVLERLRAGYADIQRGSATIKGYLASVVQLAEEQEAIARKLGVLDARQEFLQAAMQAGDGAAKALATGENDEIDVKTLGTHEAAIATFLDLMAAVKDE